MKSIDPASLRVAPGRSVKVSDFDPASTGDFPAKDDATAKLAADIQRLAALQDMLYADKRYALLIVLQGMDAAGKDGVIKHVMSGVNPQGVTVSSFKKPSEEELAHDYLWRCVKALPERGRIGIFNRSYYEEVTIARVHQSVLAGEEIPVADAEIWHDRFKDISNFERYLTRNGTVLLKFFLNISKDEQRKRLLERIDTPDKNWKISDSDISERNYWKEYQRAYSAMLTYTSTDWAPWYVIPADHKWFTRAAIGDLVVAQLEALKLAYPQVDDARRALLAEARKQLQE